MANVKWDTKEMVEGIARVKAQLENNIRKPTTEVALEILRLSAYQVPHDTGLLQNSGHTEPLAGSRTAVLVGYNKVYASRLHEHPEYNFQKGRKGKYLEDPIKSNLRVFKSYIEKGLKEILRS